MKQFKIGQHYPCPECGYRLAKIVWISKDGRTIGVQCPRKHFIKTEKTMGNTIKVWKKNCVTLTKPEE